MQLGPFPISDWCDAHGLQQLTSVLPYLVAAFVNDLRARLPLPW
jgi:hypothetical protein